MTSTIKNILFVLAAIGPAKLVQPAGPEADVLTARLGRQEIVIPSGQWGLKYFPDGRLAITSDEEERRVLMAAGISTVLLEGPNMESLKLVGRVLEPGQPGSFDNGYAGINGVYDADDAGLLAFYHAEDHEGMPRLPNGVPGFYCRVGLALSKDGGQTFRKLGPVLTSQVPKDLDGRGDQGVGELCVVPEASGKYLYMYYTSHSRIGGRGVQICLARCPLENLADLQAWRKFHDGSFEQPGRGGKDSVVLSARSISADAYAPHVTYSRAFNRYMMVFCVNAYRELRAQPEKSGIYVTYSRDGIRWPQEGWQKLITAFTVPRPGKELAWHPTLVLEEDQETPSQAAAVNGWLYYSYSENWGHRPPRTPHYLVRRPIRLSSTQ